MFNITKYGKFKTDHKNKNKKQIILCNTFRDASNYLVSLKYRNNGEFKKIPNYVITKEGKVLQLIPDDSYSEFFKKTEINKDAIIICLENNGWLNKGILNPNYYNWIGEEISKDVFIKKWRNKLYWDKYTPEQTESLTILCKKILKKFKIDKNFIGHNTKVDGIKIFNGIVCRSNYDNQYTDLSPAFEFESFKKNIEDE
jgi:N-acetyl-anhydromuramyl-L-alanine amidase AmpD